MKILQCCLYSVLFFLIICSSVQAESLLIANTSVAQTSISKDEVELVFLGKKKKWDSGEKIYLGVLKSGPLHEAFLDEFIKRTPSKFASYWKIKIVSGTGYPPKTFDTEKELVKFVAEKEGAVGYISPGTPHGSVKVLTVK